MVHQLYENEAYPKGDFTGCSRPADTATRYLSLNNWPHGEFYIMRDENDDVHLWQLKGEPRRPDEVPTIFGALPPGFRRVHPSHYHDSQGPNPNGLGGVDPAIIAQGNR